MMVLTFDFGLKRMGVAIGNMHTKTATPLKPFSAKNGKPNWDSIEALINEWKPDGLLVGLPLNMDGSESDMSLRAVKFRKRLHGRFGLPAQSWDERLTSSEAKSMVQNSDPTIRDFGEFSVDSIAAMLIFESWAQQFNAEKFSNQET